MATREWIQDSIQLRLEEFLNARNKQLPLTSFNGRDGYYVGTFEYNGEDTSNPWKGSVHWTGKGEYFLDSEKRTLFRVSDNQLLQLDKELDANGFTISLREALGI